ncbi:MAG: hypothetical protein ACM3U0_01415 [archaeon]
MNRNPDAGGLHTFRVDDRKGACKAFDNTRVSAGREITVSAGMTQ